MLGTTLVQSQWQKAYWKANNEVMTGHTLQALSVSPKCCLASNPHMLQIMIRLWLKIADDNKVEAQDASIKSGSCDKAARCCTLKCSRSNFHHVMLQDAHDSSTCFMRSPYHLRALLLLSCFLLLFDVLQSDLLKFSLSCLCSPFCQALLGISLTQTPSTQVAASVHIIGQDSSSSTTQQGAESTFASKKPPNNVQSGIRADMMLSQRLFVTELPPSVHNTPKAGVDGDLGL